MGASCKTCNWLPTAALSASGKRVEGSTFLSACMDGGRPRPQAPLRFSYVKNRRHRSRMPPGNPAWVLLPTTALSVSGEGSKGTPSSQPASASSPVIYLCFIIHP